MRKLISFFILPLLFLSPLSFSKTVYVQGHTSKHGVYKRSHIRTSRDRFKFNNRTFKKQSYKNKR